MKNLLLAAVLMTAIVALNSCSVYNGLTHNENHHQTQVVLSEKNYQIVNYVEGAASARYFLGIGGGSGKRGIIARAREHMLHKAGLIGTSRAIINETVETRVKHTLFTTEIRYIVSAYVVQFYDPEKEAAPQPEEPLLAADSEGDSFENHKLNVKTYSVGLSYAHSEANYWNTYDVTKRPGFIASLSTEYSNPNVKHLFLESQLNLVYLSWKTSNNGRPYDDESGVGLEIPLLAGLRFPLFSSTNINWHLKGGPFFNTSFVSRKVFHETGTGSYDSEFGTLYTIGLKIGAGIQVGQQWQLNLGHRFNIGWTEYDYTQLGISYRF